MLLMRVFGESAEDRCSECCDLCLYFLDTCKGTCPLAGCVWLLPPHLSISGQSPSRAAASGGLANKRVQKLAHPQPWTKILKALNKNYQSSTTSKTKDRTLNSNFFKNRFSWYTTGVKLFKLNVNKVEAFTPSIKNIYHCNYTLPHIQALAPKPKRPVPEIEWGIVKYDNFSDFLLCKSMNLRFSHTEVAQTGES